MPGRYARLARQPFGVRARGTHKCSRSTCCVGSIGQHSAGEVVACALSPRSKHVIIARLWSCKVAPCQVSRSLTLDSLALCRDATSSNKNARLDWDVVQRHRSPSEVEFVAGQRKMVAKTRSRKVHAVLVADALEGNQAGLARPKNMSALVGSRDTARRGCHIDSLD